MYYYRRRPRRKKFIPSRDMIDKDKIVKVTHFEKLDNHLLDQQIQFYENDLLNLLSQAELEEDYMQIVRFIENKKVIDSFGILKKTNSRKNINNLNYLLFSKKGRLDFLNKSINK